MDTRQAITFRPGKDADLLEALAFITKSSRNEVLKQGLHALAEAYEPYASEAMDMLAKRKGSRTPSPNPTEKSAR